MNRKELEALGFTNIVEDEDAPSVIYVGAVVEKFKKNVSAQTLRRSEDLYWIEEKISAQVRARVDAMNDRPEGSSADAEPPGRP